MAIAESDLASSGLVSCAFSKLMELFLWLNAAETLPFAEGIADGGFNLWWESGEGRYLLKFVVDGEIGDDGEWLRMDELLVGEPSGESSGEFDLFSKAIVPFFFDSRWLVASAYTASMRAPLFNAIGRMCSLNGFPGPSKATIDAQTILS